MAKKPKYVLIRHDLGPFPFAPQSTDAEKAFRRQNRIAPLGYKPKGKGGPKPKWTPAMVTYLHGLAARAPRLDWKTIASMIEKKFNAPWVTAEKCRNKKRGK